MRIGDIVTIVAGLSCIGGCIKSFLIPYKGDPKMDELRKALFSDITKIIADLQAEYKLLDADGTISIADAWTLLQMGIADLVTIANQFNVPSADKRALLLASADELYVQFIEPLEMKDLPPLIAPIADKVLHPLFTNFMTGLINYLIPA